MQKNKLKKNNSNVYFQIIKVEQSVSWKFVTSINIYVKKKYGNL